MLISGLLASAEHGINRVLQMDSTALPRLDRLSGKVVAIECTSPAFHVHILPSDEGLMLASRWESGADVTLRAPAASLMRLALSRDKNAVLHSPEVELDGESAVLLELVGVLQDLDLDWEYELQRWLGPVATPLIGGHLRNSARWTHESMTSLSHNLAGLGVIKADKAIRPVHFAQVGQPLDPLRLGLALQRLQSCGLNRQNNDGVNAKSDPALDRIDLLLQIIGLCVVMQDSHAPQLSGAFIGKPAHLLDDCNL